MTDSFEWFSSDTLEHNFYVPLPSEFRPLVKQVAYFWITNELQLTFWAACKEYENQQNLEKLMEIVQGWGKQSLMGAVQAMQNAAATGGNYAAVREYATSYSQYIDSDLRQLVTEAYNYAQASETCLNFPPLLPQLQFTCLASAFQITLLVFDNNWTPKYVLPVLGNNVNCPVVGVKVMDRYSLCFGLATPYNCFIGDCFFRIVSGYRKLCMLTKQAELPDEAYPIIRLLTEKCKAAAVMISTMLPKLRKESKETLMSMQFEVTRCQHQEIGIRLKCLHWVCWRCVFQQNQWLWVPGSICKCPTCSYDLGISEISKLLTDATFRQIIENVPFCCKCFCTPSAKNIVSLPCGHRGCLPCALRAIYEKAPMCGLCEGLPPKGQLKNMPMAQCDVCLEYRPAVSFPPVGCQGLVACTACFSSAETCPHTNHNAHALPEADKPYIQRLFFTCSACRQALNRRLLFTQAGCLCLSCRDCTIARMAKDRNPGKCPFCKETVAEQFLPALEAEVKAKIVPEEVKAAPEAAKAAPEEAKAGPEAAKAAPEEAKAGPEEAKAGPEVAKAEEKPAMEIDEEDEEEEKHPAEDKKQGEEEKEPKPKRKRSRNKGKKK